jgi:hypothetical protein
VQQRPGGEHRALFGKLKLIRHVFKRVQRVAARMRDQRYGFLCFVERVLHLIKIRLGAQLHAKRGAELRYAKSGELIPDLIKFQHTKLTVGIHVLLLSKNEAITAW